MSWRDQLRPASFRGVPFLVERHYAEGGRRAQVHEYPGRDIPYTEDLGRAAGRYDVDGFVLGDDYMAQRDRLADACAKAGPGSLVHPYLGQIDVQCLTWAIEEDVRDGRMARFRLVFAQAGANTYPRPSTNRAVAVQDKADTSLVLFGDRFSSGFSTLGALAFVVREGIALARGGVSALINLAVRLGGGAIDPTIMALATTFLRLPGLIGGVGDARRVVDVTTTVALGLPRPEPARAARAWLDLARYDPALPPVRGTTPSRQLQAANRTAYTAFLRRLALVEACSVGVLGTFDSRAEATAFRDGLSAAFDDALDDASVAGDDAAFEALRALHAETVRAIDETLPRLPRLTVVTPPQTVPALVLAYRATADAAGADDLVLRNRIRHPGFVPGGAPVEVRLG